MSLVSSIDHRVRHHRLHAHLRIGYFSVPALVPGPVSLSPCFYFILFFLFVVSFVIMIEKVTTVSFFLFFC